MTLKEQYKVKLRRYYRAVEKAKNKYKTKDEKIAFLEGIEFEILRGEK